MEKKKYKDRGVNVTISKEAHAVLTKEGIKTTPRKWIRGLINIKLNLPENA